MKKTQPSGGQNASLVMKRAAPADCIECYRHLRAQLRLCQERCLTPLLTLSLRWVYTTVGLDMPAYSGEVEEGLDGFVRL